MTHVKGSAPTPLTPRSSGATATESPASTSTTKADDAKFPPIDASDSFEGTSSTTRSAVGDVDTRAKAAPSTAGNFALGAQEISARRAAANAGRAGAPPALAKTLEGQTRAQRLTTLKRASERQLAELKGAQGKGQLTDDVAMAVSVENLRRTDWAKGKSGKPPGMGKDGPRTMDVLDKKYVAGDLEFRVDPNSDGQANELGFTPDTGKDKGKVLLSSSLKETPNQATAVIAHEGFHALNDTHSGHKHLDNYKDEAVGNHVMGKVWGELRDTMPYVSEGTLATLDGYANAASKGLDASRAHMAANYIHGHASAIPPRAGAARDTLMNLAGDKAALAHLSAEDMKQIAGSAGFLQAHGQFDGEAARALFRVARDSPGDGDAAVRSALGEWPEKVSKPALAVYERMVANSHLID